MRLRVEDGLNLNLGSHADSEMGEVMGKSTMTSSVYERTVIDIMRRLPPGQVRQLVNFAHFLELQTTEKYEEWLEEEKPNDDEEKRERLFAKPEARRVMREMAREAREEYKAGRTTDIKVTEDGRLAPGRYSDLVLNRQSQ